MKDIKSSVDFSALLISVSVFGSTAGKEGVSPIDAKSIIESELRLAYRQGSTAGKLEG